MFSSNLQFSNVHISSSVHVEHPKRQMVNIQNNRHAADPTKYGNINIYWTVPKWTYMNKVLWNICVRVISFAIWHGTDMYWCRGLLWSANSSYAQILAKVAVLAQKCTNQQVSLTSLIARKKHVQIVQKVSFFTSGKQTYSILQSWSVMVGSPKICESTWNHGLEAAFKRRSRAFWGVFYSLHFKA